MTPIQEQNDLIVKAIDWTMKAAWQITMAGGRPEHVLEQIPPELAVILIRNNLQLVFKGDQK